MTVYKPAPIDVIIPTFNNPQYLYPCLRSLRDTRGSYPLRLIIVNNGHPDSVATDDDIEVVQAGRNLGWEGGLKAGLARSTSEFVVFCNDDIYVPPPSIHWARMLLDPFRSPSVAAVGPSSNVVMGAQNIFLPYGPHTYDVPFLIGFFMLVRRSALDAVGGIDDTLPGGDDLDLCMRFRAAGYRCLTRRDVFIYHHGFKTGERVHGAYWNSADMQESTDMALIHKHGLREWFATIGGQAPEAAAPAGKPDIEADAVQQWVQGERVLELGCGGRLTVPHAVGVDLVPRSERTFRGQDSAASIVADVFSALPFEDEHADTIIARHIFEHAVDPVDVLVAWRRVLKPGGRLIVAMPNEQLAPSIPMDVTHKHAWTPDAFRKLSEGCGFRQVAYTPDCGNGISFVTVLERV
jgi:SAM-dependent methyltransferase